MANFLRSATIVLMGATVMGAGVFVVIYGWAAGHAEPPACISTGHPTGWRPRRSELCGHCFPHTYTALSDIESGERRHPRYSP